MEEIHIVVIDSASAYVEKLNKRLYDEIGRAYYYHEIADLTNTLRRSIHLFNGLEDPGYLAILLRSYESLENTFIYSGKVLSIKRYYIQGSHGPVGRLKIHADNKHLYDIPLEALALLGMSQ